MSTEFFNDQWRIPSNENQNKVSNYSIEFDGTNYTQIGPYPNNVFLQPSEAELNATGYSVSAWIKIDSSFASNGGIFANDGIPQTAIIYGLEFTIVSDRTLRIDKGDGTGRFGADLRRVITTETVPLNAWTHVAFVLPSATDTTWEIYINGVASTLSTGGSGGAVGYSGVYSGGIGRRRFEYFQGQIDQVSVFNYELPATGTNSVATLYGGGTAVTNPMSLSPKPIAYYQLGDQSVSTGPTSNYLVPNNSLSDYVFNFDGADDYIDCGSASYLNGLSEFSISCWINIPTAVDNKTIVSDWNYNTSPFGHFALGTRVVSGSYYGLNLFIKQPSDVGTNSATIATFLLENTWHNVIFSYNSGTVTCHLNGSPVAVSVTGTLPTTLTSQDGNLLIGDFAGLNRFWPGKLSNIALFNSALTSLQATTIYNNGAPGDISSLNPINWYKLNAADTFDGTDWTINDYGSGGNDGTSSGMDSSNLVVSDLQQTSGYSPYALSLDGIDDYLNCGNDSSLQITGAMTISYWVKGTSTHGAAGVGTIIDSNNPGYLLGPSTTGTISFGVALTSSSAFFIPTTQQITTTDWHHIVGVYTPSVSMKIYIDGQLSKTETSSIPSSQYAAGNDFIIGYRPCCKIDGQISNVAVWNTDLSSTQVTEIFNEGRPSNLNTFSGTAPVSWWQLGSNSSYNSGAWTCLDEIGTNNAVSAGGMTNDDIVDGVGYSASGLGTSSIDIVGDAPYSSGNGLSENQDVLARVKDTPPT